MRLYELVLVIKSDTKKEEKDKVLSSIKSMLGKITQEDLVSLGDKKLAYSLGGEKKGEYLLLKLETDKVDSDFEKRMKNQESVLRHLLIRTK